MLLGELLLDRLHLHRGLFHLRRHFEVERVPAGDPFHKVGRLSRVGVNDIRSAVDSEKRHGAKNAKPPVRVHGKPVVPIDRIVIHDRVDRQRLKPLDVAISVASFLQVDNCGSSALVDGVAKERGRVAFALQFVDPDCGALVIFVASRSLRFGEVLRFYPELTEELDIISAGHSKVRTSAVFAMVEVSGIMRAVLESALVGENSISRGEEGVLASRHVV